MLRVLCLLAVLLLVGAASAESRERKSARARMAMAFAFEKERIQQSTTVFQSRSLSFHHQKTTSAGDCASGSCGSSSSYSAPARRGLFRFRR